jgi:hypothetical protein
MKGSEKLLLAVATLLALFGLVMILGSTINLADQKPHESVASDAAVLLLAGILPLALGVWLFWRTLTGASRRAFEAREQAVVHVASRHRGVVTVPQVAEESGMTLEQAKEVLDRLYHKSFNEMTLSDSGEIIYRFQV